ncbi:hypothetical protein PC116_g32501 [Phytophthora cactorum]|nr:hypothetical protein PC116_g32501 [Phytophthora cactorum]
MIIAIAKYFGWPLDQLDVVTAFLYGIMKELVFCAVPEGVDLDGDFDCLELVKAIYGLKQASRVWNETFDEFVCSIGFQVSAFDPCLYIKVVDGHCVLVDGRYGSWTRSLYEAEGGTSQTVGPERRHLRDRMKIRK